MEKNMVNVYFFGKKYSVPAELTIMTAMEYAAADTDSAEPAQQSTESKVKTS